MDRFDERMAYLLVRGIYCETMGVNQEETLNQSNDIFPFDWEMDHNYQKKIEILSEAIEKKSLIKDIEKFKEYEVYSDERLTR